MKPAVTVDRKEEARKLRAEGMTYDAIGKRFGVSGTAVQYWVKDQFAADKRAKMKAHNETSAATEHRTGYGKPGMSAACSAFGGRHHPDDCEEAIRETCPRCGLSLPCNDCLPTNAASFAATRMVATGNGP